MSRPQSGSTSDEPWAEELGLKRDGGRFNDLFPAGVVFSDRLRHVVGAFEPWPETDLAHARCQLDVGEHLRQFNAKSGENWIRRTLGGEQRDPRRVVVTLDALLMQCRRPDVPTYVEKRGLRQRQWVDCGAGRISI